MKDVYHVMTDIHGRHDLLTIALNHLYDWYPEGGKIIFLGDYIDRGLENLKVVRTVQNPPEGWEFITLKGNHEDMFAGAYNRMNDYYDLKVVDEIRNSEDFSFQSFVEWIDQLKLTHIEDKNIFAHAFYDLNLSQDQQDPASVMWHRFYNDSVGFYNDDGYYLTHGHTPKKHGPLRAINRCNLDTGAVFTGKLTVAEFERNKVGPQRFYQFTLDGLVE